MSYCRWSSDNFRCDVYVYESVHGGWETHMAGRRRLFAPIPDLIGCRVSMVLYNRAGIAWDEEQRKPIYPRTLACYVYRAWLYFTIGFYRLHALSLRLIPLRPIGLPHDGECFVDATPGECADRLERLRAMGYRVPQSAIEALRSEHADPL